MIEEIQESINNLIKMRNNQHIGTETEINIRKEMVQLALRHYKEQEKILELADQLTDFVLYGNVPSGTTMQEEWTPTFDYDTIFVSKVPIPIENKGYITEREKFIIHQEKIGANNVLFKHTKSMQFFECSYAKLSPIYWGNFFEIEQS